MNFLQPWAFGFLGFIPIIVLLYLLKVKRRTAVVPTLLFWQRAVRDERRRALFHRLRQPLSLLFHLLIFTLILLALARPEASRGTRTTVSTVLILDTRARMQAHEENRVTRFDKARRAAGDFASHASARNEMALLTCGAQPGVLAPFSDDEKILREGLAAASATDASGSLEESVRLADQLLQSRTGEKRIVVFTATPEKIDDLKSSLAFVAVGASHDNVAITQCAARPLFNSPQTSEIFLEVRNFGGRAVRVPVDFFYDEKLLDVKQLDLPPQDRRVLNFPIVPPTSGRGWLRAHLDMADALPVDNDAFAVLPAPAPKRVLLVTRGNWFLEKMLTADSTIKFELLSPDAFRPELALNFDAIILDNALPAEFDLARLRGNFLFVKQTPFNTNESIEQPLVSETDSHSPLLRLISLQNVTFWRAQKLDVPRLGDWKFEVPLRAFSTPLILTGTRRGTHGEQRVAAFGFDVGETDLPLRVAFPLLMTNTLQWLWSVPKASGESLRAGEARALAPDEMVSASARTRLPDPAASESGAKISGVWQPLTNGWYLDERAGSKSWVAVNTFNAAESNLDVAPGPATMRAGLPFAAPPDWPFWTDLALAAWVLFLFEWWLFHRRKTE